MILRPGSEPDVEPLAAVRAHPEVHRWWRGNDLAAKVRSEFEHDLGWVIEIASNPAGWIQTYENDDEDYRSAGIDIYLDPALRGRGFGVTAVRLVVRWLLEERGHHRLTIDPAADNAAAIRCYEKVGFRPIGVARRSEVGVDGSWHDQLLMDLLREEFDVTTG